MEAKLQGCDQEGRLLSERVERLKGEREATAHEVQDKEIQLQSALDRASHHEAATAVNDAHLWWAYIWHAMKQQQDLGPLPASSANIALNLGGLGGLGLSKPENHFISEVGASGPQTLAGTHGAPQPGNYDFKPAHEAGASVHDARLRDNLRSQAIEITQLRQVRHHPLYYRLHIALCERTPVLCSLYLETASPSHSLTQMSFVMYRN